MKKFFVLWLIVLLGLLFIAASAVKGKAEMPDSRLNSVPVMKKTPDFGKIPLYFIPNKGQVAEKARFYARTSHYTLWMTEEGLVFDSVRGDGDRREVSGFVFTGANKKPGIAAVEETGHRVNYFKGKDPSKWQTGIQTSKAVLYTGIYKNIDFKVYGLEKEIEYDWLVKPGGEPGDICFTYENILSTAVDNEGNLVVRTNFGELVHKKPVAYQEVGKGQRKDVHVTFKRIAGNTYGFNVGRYDKNLELIIDPAVLVYSTYLGGSGDDLVFGLALDGSGCAYVTGSTTSTGFPTDDAYQNAFGGGEKDAFVTKLSASGNSLVYSTYLGGGGADSGEGLQVDGSGRAYIAGLTSSTNFPTKNPYQATYGGGERDVFVAILSSSGSSLAYSTYLGGSGRDRGFAIALDNGGDIYVTGQTASSDFPVLDAYQDTPGGGSYDAFVTRLDSSGSSLVYSTYLGGGGNEIAYGIAVNGSNAYAIGHTTSTDFPLQNEYQGSHGGGDYDVFVTKLSTSGKNLVYSTYLGGNQNDSGWGIAVDASGCAFVAGDTYSTDYPTQDAYQGTHAGGRDAFATKFSSSGTTLEYSTFLGGTENDAAAHVTLDNSGCACLTGYTMSSDFPVKRPYQNSYNGNLDAFVSMFTVDGGNLSFSTFLGGGDMDTARGIVVDSSGDIYAAGYTGSSDFPTENPYQNTLDGDTSGFVVKFATSQFGSICSGVDNCGLAWGTGGDAGWFEQTDTYYYDDDAVQSGALDFSNQSSFVQAVVSGPGELSFYWKVSSSYGGRLRFYIDNVKQAEIYGTGGGWGQRTYNIPEGTHTLKWSYEKVYSYISGSDCGWLDKVVYTPEITIALNRDELTFGAVQGHTSMAQTFTVSSSGSNIFNWTAAGDKSWMACSPASGTCGGESAVSVDTTGLSPGTYTGTVTLSAPAASNGPLEVEVTLKVYSPYSSSLPFGGYNTPTDNSIVMSSVPFTGWVLDDLGVQNVKLYRHNGGSLVYIGDALFVEGARPDVENLYPGFPDNYKAGWGYMMLTNFLPGGGNGTFTIEAIATDIEGHQVSLGTKTITADNAHAVKPFGAIDTPAQGGTASGASYTNWGWVLTPKPNGIPTSGTTIDVWVDGVYLGHPTYNLYRSDIAALFPGYVNSSGAGGYFNFDTTSYVNGVHSIYWIAEDSDGNSDGIGSRYFMIRNSTQGTTAIQGHPAGSPSPGGRVVDARMPVGVVKGYPKAVASEDIEMIYPDEQGIITVETRELERVAIHFDGRGRLDGRMAVGDGDSNRFRPLPIGSYLDPVKGIFCWQPGPGFSGKYRLVFIETDRNGDMTGTNILIHIKPRF